MVATDELALKVFWTDRTVNAIRLDPLSEQSMKALLANDHDKEDTAGSIETAREWRVVRPRSDHQDLELLARPAAAT